MCEVLVAPTIVDVTHPRLYTYLSASIPGVTPNWQEFRVGGGNCLDVDVERVIWWGIGSNKLGWDTVAAAAAAARGGGSWHLLVLICFSDVLSSTNIYVYLQFFHLFFFKVCISLITSDIRRYTES